MIALHFVDQKDHSCPRRSLLSHTRSRSCSPRPRARCSSRIRSPLSSRTSPLLRYTSPIPHHRRCLLLARTRNTRPGGNHHSRSRSRSRSRSHSRSRNHFRRSLISRNSHYTYDNHTLFTKNLSPPLSPLPSDRFYKNRIGNSCRRNDLRQEHSPGFHSPSPIQPSTLSQNRSEYDWWLHWKRLEPSLLSADLWGEGERQTERPTNTRGNDIIGKNKSQSCLENVIEHGKLIRCIVSDLSSPLRVRHSRLPSTPEPATGRPENPRSNRYSPSLTLVELSPSTQRERGKKRGLELGGNTFMVKPKFREQELSDEREDDPPSLGSDSRKRRRCMNRTISLNSPPCNRRDRNDENEDDTTLVIRHRADPAVLFDQVDHFVALQGGAPMTTGTAAVTTMRRSVRVEGNGLL